MIAKNSRRARMAGRALEFVEGTHGALRIVTMVGNSYYCNEVSREDVGLDGGQIGIVFAT
jgi:hypothetical protein